MPILGKSFVVLALLFGAAAATASQASRSDYDYALGQRNGQVLILEVDGNGLAWPSEIAASVLRGADTALLELDVRSGGPKAHIRASCGEQSSVQHFNSRSNGRRYLNLSSMLDQPASCSRVQLEGQGTSWSPGPARLVLFDNPDLKGKRVLVIAPHPDDAEIAAFGIYSTTNSDVVTVAAGDAGRFQFRSLYPSPATHYRVKGFIRTLDSITVPFIGGLAPGRARNLGYYGATLKHLFEVRPEPLGPLVAKLSDPAYYRLANLDPTLRNQPFEPTWPGLVASMRRELDRVKPDVIVTPNLFLDSHTDHQYSTVALIEALEAWPEKNYELYLYTNHAVDAESYPFGPRDSLVSLPPWNDPTLVFDRIYSHPLDKETQMLKIMALEAMHDLRRFDIKRPPTLRQLTVKWWKALGHKFKKNPITNSYFRRGPRPNEIFLVLRPEQALLLRSVFLNRSSDR